MNAQTETILSTILALPEIERALLAERLLESLSSTVDELTDEELFAELERRRVEVERDPSATIPWTELEKEE